VQRENPAADARPRFQHGDVEAGVREIARGGEAGSARAEN